MAKINEFQRDWAVAVELDVKIQNDLVKISHEGKLLGQGASVLGAVIDAFIQRRKAAESLQTQLCTLAALGKNPEELIEDLMNLFTEEDEGDEEDDDGDIVVEED